jgi:septal ring factor EnvC (AmiA/AmiB activator)
MLRKSLLGSLVCLALCATPALAQEQADHKHPAGINKREQRQVARIKDGKQDGTLTRAELDRLRAEQAAIRAEERVFRNSGDGLNKAEIKALQKELNKASKRIYKAKHNGR